MIVLMLIVLSGLGLYGLLKPSVKDEVRAPLPVVEVQQTEVEYLVRVSGK